MARAERRLVVCVDNTGYEVSLEKRKIYVALRDARAEKLGQLRVIDESGEDCLYPKKSFIAVALPQPVRRAVLGAAHLAAECAKLDPAFEKSLAEEDRAR